MRNSIMDEENLLLETWQKRIETMNMQQAVDALAYWVEHLENETLSLEFQTQILELVVHITRYCKRLSDHEPT